MTKCTICIEDFSKGSLFYTHCKHIFHKQCIHKWLKRSTMCPNCRQTVKEMKSIFIKSYCNLATTCLFYALKLGLQDINHEIDAILSFKKKTLYGYLNNWIRLLFYYMVIILWLVYLLLPIELLIFFLKNRKKISVKIPPKDC